MTYFYHSNQFSSSIRTNNSNRAEGLFRKYWTRPRRITIITASITGIAVYLLILNNRLMAFVCLEKVWLRSSMVFVNSSIGLDLHNTYITGYDINRLNIDGDTHQFISDNGTRGGVRRGGEGVLCRAGICGGCYPANRLLSSTVERQ